MGKYNGTGVQIAASTTNQLSLSKLRKLSDLVSSSAKIWKGEPILFD